MPSVWQEIHCTNSGGGCGGFVLMKVDVSINRPVMLICPKCKHEHRRVVKDGQILEDGRWDKNPLEELCPTIAAWSAEPRTRCMQKIVKEKSFKNERDGAVIKDDKDLIAPPFDTAQTILRESFTDRFLGKLVGR